jgi:hypothetical protein
MAWNDNISFEGVHMRYRSKIDWWFYTIFALFTLATIFIWIAYVYTQDSILIVTGILFACIECLFIVPLMLDTHYTIKNESLRVKSWICCYKEIKYSKILSVKETNNSNSAPALSTDRIEIRFLSDKGTECILISPVKRTEFIRKSSNFKS